MTEGSSTAKEEEDNEVEQGTRKYSREIGNTPGKIKVGRDENRLMNFGPYRKRTYGEVLREEPDYAKFAIKENQGDNQKARFAHWATAFVAETFFAEEEEEQEEEVEEDKMQLIEE